MGLKDFQKYVDVHAWAVMDSSQDSKREQSQEPAFQEGECRGVKETKPSKTQRASKRNGPEKSLALLELGRDPGAKRRFRGKEAAAGLGKALPPRWQLTTPLCLSDP